MVEFDPDGPTLIGLAWLLEHPYAWPIQRIGFMRLRRRPFQWSFHDYGHCAIGLARCAWPQIANLSPAAIRQIFNLNYAEWLAIFDPEQSDYKEYYPNVTNWKEITPGDVAQAIRIHFQILKEQAYH